MYTVYNLQESPFIGSSDSLDLVDSEEENGRKMERLSFLEVRLLLYADYMNNHMHRAPFSDIERKK